MKTIKKRYAAAAFALAGLVPALSHAAGTDVLNEGFNNVGNLSGWSQVNSSSPVGSGWFQGNSGILGAQAGGPSSYIATNFLGAANGIGSVDNWLITPMLNLSGTSTLSFYTSNANDPGFSDLLEVRFATGNDAFSTLLLSIGGAGTYPTAWQQFSASVNVDGPGRFAFRYVGDASTLSYIGIDSVRVISAVPEPSLYLSLMMGLGALSLLRRKFVK